MSCHLEGIVWGSQGHYKKQLGGGRAHNMGKENQKKNQEDLRSLCGGKREGKVQDECQVSGMSEWIRGQNHLQNRSEFVGKTSAVCFWTCSAWVMLVLSPQLPRGGTQSHPSLFPPSTSLSEYNALRGKHWSDRWVLSPSFPYGQTALTNQQSWVWPQATSRLGRQSKHHVSS